MDKSPCTILVADDDSYIRDGMAALLADSAYTLQFASTADETWTRVVENQPDLVLLDIRFPDCEDLSLLRRIREAYPRISVILLTSQTDNLERVVESIKLGAYDFVGKPFSKQELLNRIQNVASLHALQRAQDSLIEDMENRLGIMLVGESTTVKVMRERIHRIADSPSCVLVRGETGTGKEIVARSLHFLSKRRNKPFIAVNCASIPENLVESEFFGHRRGAFTGAIDSAKGKFQLAADGTIFLDEIGDMPLEQQGSLLRVLEQKRFTPIGDAKEMECHARFVFATNRDLKEAVRQGHFREDLFYRINVAVIETPALRDRPEDIDSLVSHFALKLSAEIGIRPVQIDPVVFQKLRAYDWPGNIRELKNVIEGVLMFMSPNQSTITISDLPAEILACSVPEGTLQLSHSERLERDELIRVLKQCGGNHSQAAVVMGFHRNTIRAKVRHYGISSID